MALRLLCGTLMDIGDPGTGNIITVDDAVPPQMQEWWYEDMLRDVFQGEQQITLDQLLSRVGSKYTEAARKAVCHGDRKLIMAEQEIDQAIQSLQPAYPADDWRTEYDSVRILQWQWIAWKNTGEVPVPGSPMGPIEWFQWRVIRDAIGFGQAAVLVGRARFAE